MTLAIVCIAIACIVINITFTVKMFRDRNEDNYDYWVELNKEYKY